MVNFFGIQVTFKGNLAAGSYSGFCDDLKCWSNEDVQEALLKKNMVEKCLPPSKWFSKGAYIKALNHVRKKDAIKATEALTKDSILKGEDLCIETFKIVMLAVAKGCPRLLSDALPFTYY